MEAQQGEKNLYAMKELKVVHQEIQIKIHKGSCSTSVPACDSTKPPRAIVHIIP